MSARLAMAVGRCALSGALLFAAGAKIASGHDPDFAISAPRFWGSTVLEAALGLLLWSPVRRGAIGCVILLCLASVAHAWTTAEDRHCGCLGNVLSLERRERIAVASALGALASALLLRRRCGRELLGAELPQGGWTPQEGETAPGR